MRSTRSSRVLPLVLLTLAFALPAGAGWDPAGVLLHGPTYGNYEAHFYAVPGGIRVAWYPQRGTDPFFRYEEPLSKTISDQGDVVDSLDANGTRLCDDAAGVLPFYTYGTYGAIDSIGMYLFRSPTQPWPHGAMRIGDGSGSYSQVRPLEAVIASDGGAIVCWEQASAVFVNRVQADGSFLPDWSLAPFQLISHVDWATIADDGRGGVWGMTFGDAGGSWALTLQHLNALGHTTGGFALPKAIATTIPVGPGTPHLLALPNGDAVAGWKTSTDVNSYLYTPGDLHVRRLKITNGTTVYNWTLHADGASQPMLLGDGSDGAYALWIDTLATKARIHAIHLDGTGAVVSGWPAGGEVLTQPGTVFRPVHEDVFTPYDVFAATDDSGGLFVGWGDSGGAVIVHRTASDLPGPGWDSAPYSVSPLSRTIGVAAVPGSAGTMAYVAFDRQILFGQPWYASDEPYVGRFAGPNPTGVPTVARPARLALAVSPNPASGAVRARIELPLSTPARLELLDVTGRVLETRELAGAGVHDERLAALDQARSGVYFVRVAQGADTRIARIARIR